MTNTYLMPIFQAVSIIFAVAAVFTGAHAIIDPIGFSKSFGLPITITATLKSAEPSKKDPRHASAAGQALALSYVSLMGVRQLATGLILSVFAYQRKWNEMATVLAIIGIIVAGTDGIHLARAGKKDLALFHAIPGALIAALAGGVLYTHA